MDFFYPHFLWKVHSFSCLLLLIDRSSLTTFSDPLNRPCFNISSTRCDLGMIYFFMQWNKTNKCPVEIFKINTFSRTNLEVTCSRPEKRSKQNNGNTCLSKKLTTIRNWFRSYPLWQSKREDGWSKESWNSPTLAKKEKIKPGSIKYVTTKLSLFFTFRLSGIWFTLWNNKRWNAL